VERLRIELFAALEREQHLLDDLARLSAPSAALERELIASLGQATADVMAAAQAAARGVVERAHGLAPATPPAPRRPTSPEARAVFDKLRAQLAGPPPVATLRHVPLPERLLRP
jgi:hypothetical protein